MTLPKVWRFMRSRHTVLLTLYLTVGCLEMAGSEDRIIRGFLHIAIGLSHLLC